MLSIIIPVYNEATEIVKLIAKIRENCARTDVDIIVVDGGSTDDTLALAVAQKVTVVTAEKGRAKQMNKGAKFAKMDVLYFLHADSVPPPSFDTTIFAAIDNGASCGCFRLKFDVVHWFLAANSWFTRFNVNAVRFGDQSLFATKAVFNNTGGFREGLIVMEDQEIIHRLKKHGKFVVMNDYIITSARKYLANGVYRMQSIFFRIWAMYYLGYSQDQLLNTYKKLIVKHKL